MTPILRNGIEAPSGFDAGDVRPPWEAPMLSRPLPTPADRRPSSSQAPHGAAKNNVFLIVDRGPADIVKKTKNFVASLEGRLNLFYLPPYSSDNNPDDLVWKQVKSDAVGRASIVHHSDFRTKS